MTTVAYHFWSPTCGPCKVIKPAIQDLKEEFPEVQWITVNTQEDPHRYSEKYDVKFVPTIVVVTINVENNIIQTEKQSGTTLINYYRMIKNSIRLLTTCN